MAALSLSHRNIIAPHHRGRAPLLPPIGGLFMTTNPDRSRCSTRRLATIFEMSLVGVVDALAALKAQREGQRVCDVFWRGGERVSRSSGIWRR